MGRPFFTMSKRPPALAQAVALFLLAWMASAAACLYAPSEGDGTGGAAVAAGGGSPMAGAGGSGGSRIGGAGGSGAFPTGGVTGAGGGGSDLATFATVREIVSSTCGGSGCHQPGDTPPTLLVDDAKLYSTLMTFVSKRCGNRVLVKPRTPEDSAFYLAQAGLCGDTLPRMPFGCVDRCTPQDYLEGVRQWIQNGAPQE